MSKARGKWIIFLDADEYLDEQSIEKLSKLINDESCKLCNYNVVAFKMINIDAYHERTIDEVFKVRMFKNREIFYEGKVHEYLVSKTGEFELLNLYKDITIYHTGYSSNVAKKRQNEILR